ncbi:MAG: OmpA family protein [Proteobacteria bacterium]|nr:OmpA family protein [Pseudomonadota bacterium]
MPLILRLLILFLVFLSGGCKPMADFSDINLFQQQRTASLEELLARGYGLLAQYEGYNAQNPVTAAKFDEKAKAAEKGALPTPDSPSISRLPQKDFTEIAEAHGMLKNALSARRGASSNLKLAEAQINYDCWLARAESDSQIGGIRTESWCRERYYAAIEGLQSSGPKHFTVYFSNASAVPDSSNMALIRQAAASFAEHENWRIRLTGHTDPTGSKNENIMLSMRRALAVRNILAQNGVELDHITIAAAGDTKSRKEDESATESYRRVDIAIIPAYMDRGEKGEPDITKILPNYFGSEAQGW